MNYNKYIDHTLLKANATTSEIDKLIDEAINYNFMSVCLNPTWIKYAREKLSKTSILVCTVIGFPLGQMNTASKVFEAKEVEKDGAQEVDMVANVSWIKEAKYDLVENEISKIKKSLSKNIILKVIIETALLTDEEIKLTTERVLNSGADFVKTSTGFSTRGASFNDVEIMKKVVGDKIGIKAAGGVSTFKDMEKMISLGATRIGTSRGVSLMEGIESKEGY